MPLRSRRHFKEELSNRLVYYPLLRLLLFEKWFRLAFLALVAFGIAFALYLPKIWQTTPDGVTPVINVSGLDMTQAWSLKRAARHAATGKNFDRANDCWHSAAANNPGDADAFRGLLENAIRLRTPGRRTTEVLLGQTFWLLNLTQTNHADVELCARIYEKFRWPDVVLHALAPIASNLPPAAEAIYIKALFHQNRIAEFEQALARAEGKLNDPTLPLYQAAFLAGWKNGPESLAAFAQLREARLNPEMKVVATRLCMIASGAKADLAAYSDNLHELAQMNEATVSDHVAYWRLLAANGKKQHALNLAGQFSISPQTAAETVHLSETYHHLGLIEECRALLKQFAPQFPLSPGIWIAYANVLEYLGDWTALRAIALQIREQPGFRETLGGFSHFLEGKADLGQERITTAEMCFERAAESSYHFAPLGLEVARGLLKLGHPEFTREILVKIEAAMAPRQDYWETAFDTAYLLKDAEWILKAARECHQLAPNDPSIHNRYAAALMVNRTKPEEAIKVTVQLLTIYPEFPSVHINHALALLLNHRFAEAKSTLANVIQPALNPVETSAYYLALFELNYRLQNFELAREASEKIEPRQLFPPQLRWLEERRKELGARFSS